MLVIILHLGGGEGRRTQELDQIDMCLLVEGLGLCFILLLLFLDCFPFVSAFPQVPHY